MTLKIKMLRLMLHAIAVAGSFLCRKIKIDVRKVTKSRTVFPSDDALFKMLYLAMTDATRKWTGKSWEWGQTLDQLCIYFGDRIRLEDIV